MSGATFLTRSQSSAFFEEGFVKLAQAFRAEESTAMLELVWSELESVHGIDRTDPSTWHIERPTHLQAIKRDKVFQPIGGGWTTSAIDGLLGVGAWDVATQWGGFHIAFPPRPLQ